ncbi:putative isopenicillin N synthetase [Teratosphaeria nubilosa]|uniref:Putative isopenicillin N synthetase n=1 Tax=Teratosphaeria nubilosa TaxID=161662 RepID=A0A6G1L331_9PEZI|nr:putative isopenicillin N synthetase [Teratosphaeria nubilosa]
MSTTTVQLEQSKATIRLPSGQTVAIKSEASIEVDEIPIIDVSGIRSDDLAVKQKIAEQVREASHRIGFFYAQHHGIDPKFAEAAFEQGRRFCALPLEKKLEVDTSLVPNEYVGYHRMDGYKRNGHRFRDLSEAFNWNYDAAYDPQAVDESERGVSIWPSESDLPGFKDDLYAYHAQVLRFARRMTRIFALALHMPEDYFDEYVRRPEAGMRIIHYPEQQATAADQNGIGAHTDFECFTMVTQDENAGLEVLNKQGYWIKAPPVPGAFVVNIADCFMRQTNDFFVSTVHRVVNKSSKERYSLPFFFGFDRSKKLEAIPTCISDSNPMKYPTMTSGEYYLYRANAAKTGSY